MNNVRLSLAQTQAVAALARHLYDYLPGSSRWVGTYTFGSAAIENGVGAFWVGGSKLPALTQLLEMTLGNRSSAFCPLIESVVREGLKYRLRSGAPITKPDLVDLNALIASVGFKIPSLCDPAFASSLPDREAKHSAENADSDPTSRQTALERDRLAARRAALSQLRERFLQLHGWSDRQSAGRELERLLRAMFDEFDLRPRGSFVVPGEQIDGSIVLDGSSYLVEAKWEAGPVGVAPLLVFREKVLGKSSVTRGIFVSVNGYDAGARASILTGKQPNFLMLDGMHLFAVLSAQRDLIGLLRALLRELADTGRPFVWLPDVPDEE